MTKEQYEGLVVGQLVRHVGGKLYKVTSVHPAEDDTLYFWRDCKLAKEDTILVGEEARVAWAKGGNDACSYNRAHGHEVRFVQWQVNEKFPQGRPYQASRLMTADKVELV